MTTNHLSASVGDEFVILGLRTEQYYGLGGVGARAWELIQQPRSFVAVVDTIVEEFEVERQKCEEDLAAFIGKLSELGIVNVAKS